MQVRIFSSRNVRDLESAMNEWLAATEGKYEIVDIKYSTATKKRADIDSDYTAMIIYKDQA